METASKNCEITSELVRLNERKETLHDRLGMLLDRLNSLLSQPQTKENVGGMPQPSLTSQMAIDLSSVSATLETDIEKVDDTIQRLEL